MLGVPACGDGHEAHDEPFALRCFLPCHGAVFCHSVGQVYDVVGQNRFHLIIYRGTVGLDEFRNQTRLLLPFVYTGTG